MNDARANSVKNLENLYTVVVGLGLSLGIYYVIDSTLLSKPVRLDILPIFASFLITLVPFYHGALRHLDSTYIERKGSQIPRGALLIDFILLFIESCTFIALAVLLKESYYFAWGLFILFTVDIIWGVFTHFTLSRDAEQKAEAHWAFLNFITAGLLFLFLFFYKLIPESERTTLLWVFLLVLCLVRTVIDYIKNWNFYLPKNSS